MSENKKTIYERLSDFREAVGKVAKDGANPAFRSRYATLPGILDAIQEPLRANGLVFIQSSRVTESGDVAVLTAIRKIEASPDDYGITGEMSMRPVDQKPQTYGSCLTYLRRYGLVTVLGLNVDDDDDGNAASGVKPKMAAPAAALTPEDLPF